MKYIHSVKTYSMSCKNITNPTTTTMMLLSFVPSCSGFGRSTHYVRKAKKTDHAKVNYGRLAKCCVRDKKW